MTKLELHTRVAELHREIDSLAAEVTREREDRLRGLQLAARWLRQAESTAQWVEMLADGAAPMAKAVSFFRVDGGALYCEAARGMGMVEGAISLADAPAFRQAVETRETVVSLFAASQLSRAAEGNGASRRRAHLFPLVGKTRVLGVLLALDDEGLDVYGLEVLLSLGAAALELRDVKGGALIGAAPMTRPVAKAPSARRFARVTVARWILEETALVETGRERGDVYGAMGALIDGARGVYQSRYMPGPDYLHAELVARMGSKLGPGYPGPLGGGRRA